MKKSIVSILIFVIFLDCFTTQAQVDTSFKKHRIAVFLPLYLDSAFDSGNNYRYDKSFPKFLSPGLEFYEGAQLALDTLEHENVSLEIKIYDTRSVSNNISKIIQSPDFESTELIIGYVNPAELRQLADVASHKAIPFININFPNDGGITNNPDLVILNSTLKTHCEGIYKFMQKNYALAPILVFTKKGAQEEKLKNYFVEAEKSTASVPLKLKYINLEEPVNAKKILPYLDSTKQTICLVASLDENFGKNITMQLASVNTTYTSTVIGMPTWDNTDFSQPEFNNQEIIYTTPFYSNQSDTLVRFIQQYFRSRYFSRPSDMVFRGYETIYHFGKLLQLYGHGLNGSVGEKKYKVFNDFDIQPVFLNKQTMILDYFENRKLYFIKKVNGNITAVY